MVDQIERCTFTVYDLMARWSCSYSEVLKAIREKRLAVFVVGARRYRVTLAEVERFERGADR
jgi:hypothetical protein